jgi:hypothetical protein
MTYDYEQDEYPRYAPLASIKAMHMFNALRQLHFINDDMHMRTQAHNLAIVDEFLTNLEYQVLNELIVKERTPPEAFFLGAQSQMWIFAAYELLRTWMQRTKEFISLRDNGGLKQKLDVLKAKDYEYLHHGLEMRIGQLEYAIANPEMIDDLRVQLLHMYIPYTRLEYIRVSLAKHEVSGKGKSIALSPGGGRINTWCGSLDYELENGKYSMGTISRRDIADSFRAIDLKNAPPDIEMLESFDNYMSGKKMDEYGGK